MFDDGTLLRSCQKEICELRKQLTEVVTNSDLAETFEEFSSSNSVVFVSLLVYRRVRSRVSLDACKNWRWKRKRYTAEWNSEILNRAEFFLVYLICCERGTHTCYVFSIFSLDGRIVGATTSTTGKKLASLFELIAMVSNIKKKEISFCALSVFVFLFQSEQEAREH